MLIECGLRSIIIIIIIIIIKVNNVFWAMKLS
jgi:hypothetical protein